MFLVFVCVYLLGQSLLLNGVAVILHVGNQPYIFFSMARQPLGGLGHLIFRGFTVTHFLDTLHSVGLLWTRDQLVTETST
jgi:hypothetical protein